MVQLGRENCFVLLLKRVYPRVINEGQFMSLSADAFSCSIELTIVRGAAKGSGIHIGS